MTARTGLASPARRLLRPVIALADARRVDGARQAVTGSARRGGVFGRRDRYVTDWDDAGQAQRVKEHRRRPVPRARLGSTEPRRVAVATPDDQVACSTRGMRSSSAPAAGGACPTSRASRPRTRGRTARPPSSSGARPARGRRRRRRRGRDGHGAGRRSAHRSPSSPEATACCTAWSPSPASWSPRRSTEAGADVRTGVSVGELQRRQAAPGRSPCRWTTAASSRPTRCSSPPAGRRTPTTSGWRPSASCRAPGWTSTTTCRVLRHRVGWLYAVGDVNHRALLTHQGKYQARIAGDAIARACCRTGPVETRRGAPTPPPPTTPPSRRSSSPTPRRPPSGLTRREAEQAGHRVRASTTTSARSSGRQALRRRLPGSRPHGRRPGPRGPARRHLRRPRRRRTAALGDGRRRRPRCRSTGCGTRSRASRRSARSGCGCSRPTAAE